MSATVCVEPQSIYQGIYSDNGLNFVDARNELNELGRLFNDIKFKLAVRAHVIQMEWHMSPPKDGDNVQPRTRVILKDDIRNGG